MQAADSLEVCELLSNLHCSKQTSKVTDTLLERDAGLGWVPHFLRVQEAEQLWAALGGSRYDR